MKRIYTYKELDTITNDMNFELDELQGKIKVLFAYACDMCDSVDNDELKDMSELVIGISFSKAIAFRYVYEKQQTYNKTLEDVKSMLVKTIGSYIMVCFYNWFTNTTDLNVEFVQKQDSIEITDLVLKVGNEILDGFEITKKMINNDLEFSEEKLLNINYENFCEEIIGFQNKVDAITEK